MKILVPVDGSKNSLNAVQFIGSRKTLLGSEPKIELLNVQLPLPARACRHTALLRRRGGKGF